MTDEEPEPFRMAADPAAQDEPIGPDDEPRVAADADQASAAPAESIADLIDEAARTAAEQAAAEEQGHAPEDRSADVWGESAEAPAGGTDAVWRQAQDDAASAVWDLDGTDDAMWGSAGAPIHDREPDDEPIPPAEPAAGRPAAAEGMPDDDDLEPETFTFAVDEGAGATPPATAAPDPDGAGGPHEPHGLGEPDEPDEPETFSFPAGPATTAPAALPDHTGEEDEEPEAFSFAVAEDQSPASAAPSDRVRGATAEADEVEAVEEWTVPGADAADEDTEVNDDVWTFSVTTDQDSPLADTASPRDDAGWHDLEAEQEPDWEASDLATQSHTRRTAEDAEGLFAAALEAHDDDLDEDAPWTSPALPDDQAATPSDQEQAMPPADVVTAEVQDALGDLLGNGEEDAVVDTAGPAAAPPSTAAATSPAAAADPGDVADDAGLDDFDHLEDLDHLDDIAAAAVPPGDDREPGGDAASPDGDEEPAAEVERPLDAPTAARQVMEPGSVTFSSSPKKKRGFFG